MVMKNPTHRWGMVSQAMHWATLALLVWIAWLGLGMVEMPNTPAKISNYALHKSLGLTLLALVLLRLAWRVHAGAPAPLATTPTWQARVASMTHVALYVLMLAIPFSGWLFNSASGYPLQWFKQFNLPALAGGNQGMADLAAGIHEYGFWLLVALVALHAGAAVYHHVIQRDDTLARMLPLVKRRNTVAVTEPEY